MGSEGAGSVEAGLAVAGSAEAGLAAVVGSAEAG